MAVCIRRATVKDLKLMQNCNLTCLPENYRYRYYMFHLSSWPEILFVAEDRPDHIVGYVLAKMEDDVEGMKRAKDPPYPNGHITSLSVFRTYRKLGIATRLMNAAHEEMKRIHGARYVSLHVRKSNTAAIHLYTQTLGYIVHHVEKGYYNDGEDALRLRLYLDEEVKKEDGGIVEEESPKTSKTTLSGGKSASPKDPEASKADAVAAELLAAEPKGGTRKKKGGGRKGGKGGGRKKRGGRKGGKGGKRRKRR